MAYFEQIHPADQRRDFVFQPAFRGDIGREEGGAFAFGDLYANGVDVFTRMGLRHVGYSIKKL